MFFVSNPDGHPENTNRHFVKSLEAQGLPPLSHPAEADCFVRQVAVPGHDQDAISRARVLLVGAGGLGSWIGLGLVRMGVTALTIIEPDSFDRTNASRQLMFSKDLGHEKAFALAENLLPHAVVSARVTGIALTFEEAAETLALPADVAIVVVDNNPCRLSVARFARRNHIPAVFSMLSLDGLRVNTFLQGPDEDAACVHCALPNLDPDEAAPCAASIISTCFASAAHSLFFFQRAVTGWDSSDYFNWRETDQSGTCPELSGVVQHRPGCPTCSR